MKKYDFYLVSEPVFSFNENDYGYFSDIEINCKKTGISASVEISANLTIKRQKQTHDCPPDAWVEKVSVCVWDWKVYDSDGLEIILSDDDSIAFELDVKEFFQDYFLTA